MQTIVGIDLGTTKVCTLVGETDDRGDLQVVGVGVVPSKGMRKGIIVNVQQAADAIAESVEKAERTSGYKITRANVSLAGEHISSTNSVGVVAVGGDEAITSEDVDRALDSARAVSIPHGREIIHIIPAPSLSRTAARSFTLSREVSRSTDRMACAARWVCMRSGSRWRHILSRRRLQLCST